MRRFFIVVLFLITVFAQESRAQLDKGYFFWIGRNFIIDDKYHDAIETLNILLRVDEKAHEGYFLRGIAKYNLDDLIGAEQDFSRAIQTNPVFTVAYQYRAITRSRLGNYDDALKDFQEAIDLRPDQAGPYFSRGVTYLLSQQPEKAIDDFTTFIKHQNKVVDAYLNRGACYLMIKDTARAFEDYDEAIRINRERPDSYSRRGTIYAQQEQFDKALEDFNQSIQYDSTFVPSYFYRALVHANTNRPVQAIEDFSRVIELDSTSAVTYFNRAILRSQIGDYNNALEDYNEVEYYNPNNVLVYYNRGGLYAQLGYLDEAIKDYTRAIELYPDFANAYLARSSLRYWTNDQTGSRSDRTIAEQKIAEYQSKLNDSTFSIYADTSKHFNQLLSFDTHTSAFRRSENVATSGSDIRLLPMFKFSLVEPDTVYIMNPYRYFVQAEEDFIRLIDHPNLKLVNRETDLAPEVLFEMDTALDDSLRTMLDDWQLLFRKALSQSLIRQYTNSLNYYTAAIDRNPSNPFLYMNRSTTRAEMIDFISSIDNNFQRITVDNDPASHLKSTSVRTYDYDDAIGDLNKAIKLLPDYAYFYYNRATLQCRSGYLPEAIEDYTRAIELNPAFGAAYYNRGLIQIFLKDTQTGYLDMSKAGELGVSEAYPLLREYGLAADRND